MFEKWLILPLFCLIFSAGSVCAKFNDQSGLLALLSRPETTISTVIDIDIATCKKYLAQNPGSPDGEYDLQNLLGTELNLTVYCDMTTDGGGWTRITQQLAKEHLGAVLTGVETAALAGIDSSNRPYTQDDNGSHTYYYTIPPGRRY